MLTLGIRGENMLQLDDKYKMIFLLVLSIGLTGIGFFSYEKTRASSLDYELEVYQATTESLEQESIIEEVSTQIPVYVCGAVKNAGVYYLPLGSLVEEAVQFAGGFAEEADATRINLAKEIVAHEQIVVPYIGQEGIIGESSNGLININTATLQELCTLPGIGEIKAGQIIAYRESHGAFTQTEALKNVSGIGEKIYAALEEYITIK
jgi:competence protein ComEA